MKVSTRARYGIQLMISLGISYGNGQVFLKDIAQRERISEKYLSQIIIGLKVAGLVNSFRGARGGYVLARPPEGITVNDIIDVLEGGFDFAGSRKNISESTPASAYVMCNLWNKLSDKMTKTLQSITLADLVEQCREQQERNVMYNI